MGGKRKKTATDIIQVACNTERATYIMQQEGEKRKKTGNDFLASGDLDKAIDYYRRALYYVRSSIVSTLMHITA